MTRLSRSRVAAVFAAAPLMLPLSVVCVAAGCGADDDVGEVELEERTPEQEAEMNRGRAAAEQQM